MPSFLTGTNLDAVETHQEAFPYGLLYGVGGGSVYSVFVRANFPVNTNNIAIELIPYPNTQIKIRRIMISYGSGLQQLQTDSMKLVQFIYENGVSAGGKPFTPIPLNAMANPALTQVNVNTNVGNFILNQYLQVVDQISMNAGTQFRWEARDEDDKIIPPYTGVFAIIINPAPDTSGNNMVVG